MVESSRTQPIKWTTEGKVKSVSRVFFDVRLTSVVIDVIASTKSTILFTKEEISDVLSNIRTD